MSLSRRGDTWDTMAESAGGERGEASQPGTPEHTGTGCSPQALLNRTISVSVPVGMPFFGSLRCGQLREELSPAQELARVLLCGATAALQAWSEPGCGSPLPDVHVTGLSLAAATSNASSSAETSLHIPARSPVSLPCPLPPQLAKSDARGKAALLAAEQGQERGLSSERLGGSSMGLFRLFSDGVHHRSHL